MPPGISAMGYGLRSYARLMEEDFIGLWRMCNGTGHRSPHPANHYLNSRAFLNNYLGEYALAMEDISRVMEINPECPKGWTNLSCAQRKLELYEEVVQSFTRGMEFQF